MAAANLKTVFKLIVGEEGGYVNDPKDRGGPTKYGVTLETLRGFRGNSVTPADVAALGLDEARAIFKAQYWDKIQGDNLPSGVDFALADMAYNSGVGRAVQIFQRLIGVQVDGVAGAVTARAAKDAEAKGLINEFCDARLAFLRTTYGWGRFGNGWTNRVARVRAKSLDLAAPDGLFTTAAEPLGVMTGTKDDHTVSFARTSGGQLKIAAGAGVLGTQLSDMAQQLTPYTETFAILKYAFIALTIAGLCLSAYATFQRLSAGAEA